MIQLRGVSKTVESGGHPLTILHPLDYTIESGRFVAIVGPSGSGKSSVVRAGLVPTLRQSEDVVWEIGTIVPGDRPLRAAAAAYAHQPVEAVPSDL